jgi:RNA polymerase sigma factor (sigma-70 family)
VNSIRRLTLNDAYASYRSHPSDDSLSALFDSCREYASNLTRRYPDGDDLAAGAIVKAWRSLDRFRGGSQFSTWFHSLVVRHVADAYRQKFSRDARESRIEYVDAPERPDRDSAQLPLSDGQRELVASLARTGSYHETAAELGLTLKALHRRLDRIKTKVCQTGEKRVA